MKAKTNQQYLDEAKFAYNRLGDYKNPAKVIWLMLVNLTAVVQNLEWEAKKNRV